MYDACTHTRNAADCGYGMDVGYSIPCVATAFVDVVNRFRMRASARNFYVVDVCEKTMKTKSSDSQVLGDSVPKSHS